MTTGILEVTSQWLDLPGESELGVQKNEEGDAEIKFLISHGSLLILGLKAIRWLELPFKFGRE